MKKQYLLFLTLTLKLSCFSQYDFLQKRFYKIDGYIVIGIDTIKGIIAIPIERDEIDYGSLSKKVSFIDSIGKTKRYKPADINSFGLTDEAVRGTYMSAATDHKKVNDIFLKKIVDGEVLLLENRFDRAGGYTNTISLGTNGFGLNPSYQQEINKSVFYFKKSNELIKIELNKKNGLIKKNELQKLLDIFPQEYKNSDDEIGINEIVAFLTKFNSKLTNVIVSE
jgi:hypothetical protein